MIMCTHVLSETVSMHRAKHIGLAERIASSYKACHRPTLQRTLQTNLQLVAPFAKYVGIVGLGFTSGLGIGEKRGVASYTGARMRARNEITCCGELAVHDDMCACGGGD